MTIDNSVIFLRETITKRLDIELKKINKKILVFDVGSMPNNELKSFILENHLNQQEIIVVLVSLIPHVELNPAAAG